MKKNKSIGRDLAIGAGIGILISLIVQVSSSTLFFLTVALIGSVIGGQLIGKWWGAVIGVIVSYFIVFLFVISFFSD